MTTATTNAVAFPHLTPTTAIAYLKAIGLLRLSGAVGYWANDCFHLEIDSAEDLVKNILDYKPKPFASPWNGDSIFKNADKVAGPCGGFVNEMGANKKGKAKTVDLEAPHVLPGDMSRGSVGAVLRSQSERYALMREGYQEIQDALQKLDNLENVLKQTPEQKKLILVPHLSRRVENSHWLEWLNAVGLMTNTSKGLKFRCNDLLGTGGNVGKTEFSTSYLQVCNQLWDLDTGNPSKDTEAFIRASVLGEALPKTITDEALLGHTYPAADYFDDLAPSGMSQADYLDNGGRSSQLANPIDLILYLEGATTFTGKSIPRNEIQSGEEQEYTLAAYPLLLEVNSGSADTSDRTGRANEVWLPLWEEPMNWEDFQYLVTNDLAFRLKNQVVDTIDMLNIITERDQQREGLSRYARFGLWTRKGQGKYLIHVGLAVPAESDIGAELREWRFQARPTEKQSQAQYNLLTAIHKSLYRLQQGNAEVTSAIRLLGQLEIMHSRIQAKVPPVPQLKKEWIEAVYKEYPIPEVELAAALVSAIPKSKHPGKSYVYSFRQLLTSARYIKEKDTYFWDKKHVHKLKTSSLEAFCLSVLKLWNEIWDSKREYHPSFGWTYWASPDAIAAFIAGNTNDQLILELALGFALCKIPSKLAPYSNTQPLPTPYKYAASLQWCPDTVLTVQTINGLLAGSTVPLSRQLAAVQKPVVLPSTIATGKRSALALVFPCQPFYQFGETNA